MRSAEIISNYPHFKGVVEAALYWSKNGKETGLTDRMAVTAILLMFPEFGKLTKDIQALVVTAHGIDDIADAGNANKNHILVFNTNFRNLEEKFNHTKGRNPLLSNLCGFLSQAATVENVSHKWENPSEKKITEYRELINAIWTRMIVSFGTGLLRGEFDMIAGTQGDYDEILKAYKPYIEGKYSKIIPEADRNIALYFWTMSIQAVYDDIFDGSNSRMNLPHFRNANGKYTEKTVAAGVNHHILSFSETAVRQVWNLKKIGEIITHRV